jgi:hypothetical protein
VDDQFGNYNQIFIEQNKNLPSSLPDVPCVQMVVPLPKDIDLSVKEFAFNH